MPTLAPLPTEDEVELWSVPRGVARGGPAPRIATPVRGELE